MPAAPLSKHLRAPGPYPWSAENLVHGLSAEKSRGSDRETLPSTFSGRDLRTTGCGSDAKLAWRLDRASVDIAEFPRTRGRDARVSDEAGCMREIDDGNVVSLYVAHTHH